MDSWFASAVFFFLKWVRRVNVKENDTLHEKVLRAHPPQPRPNFLCSDFAPRQTFLITLSFLSVRKVQLSSSQLPSTLHVCNQAEILSYWRPVQPVLCLSDVFTTLSNFSSTLTLPRKVLPPASQRSITSTSQSNSNTALFWHIPANSHLLLDVILTWLPKMIIMIKITK